MGQSPFPAAERIDAVIFDFHSTLVDQGSAVDWVAAAWSHLGRPGTPAAAMGDDAAGWERRMDLIWERARELDPTSERDRSAELHRGVYDTALTDLAERDADLVAALYEVMLTLWFPYDDALPTLQALRARGVAIALLSNIGMDIRPLLDQAGLSSFLDAVVLSYEVGAVKPESAIFQQAVDALGVPARRTLMVGDSWKDDAGAAQLGIRCLLLPRTSGPSHGLNLVPALVDASRVTG
jgi:HAD superfamily hydrolase (TIGR01509 family)